MINKKLLAYIFLSILLTFNAFAAGSSDSGSSNTKRKYDKPNINIRKHHMFVSKRAYIAQNMIKSKGLSFFREFAHEESK